jgi:hypothetical protein
MQAALVPPAPRKQAAQPRQTSLPDMVSTTTHTMERLAREARVAQTQCDKQLAACEVKFSARALKQTHDLILSLLKSIPEILLKHKELLVEPLVDKHLRQMVFTTPSSMTETAVEFITRLMQRLLSCMTGETLREIVTSLPPLQKIVMQILTGLVDGQE